MTGIRAGAPLRRGVPVWTARALPLAGVVGFLLVWDLGLRLRPESLLPRPSGRRAKGTAATPLAAGW